MIIELTTSQVLKIGKSDFLEGWKILQQEILNQHNLSITFKKIAAGDKP